MIYGERLRQARELCGLTQTGLSRKVGVNQSAIAHIESDRNTPTEDLLKAIANETGLLPSFFEEEPPEGFPLGSLSFRARMSLSVRDQAKAYQYAKTMFEHVKKMVKRLDIPAVRLPRLAERPPTAASVTRAALGLSPDEPVSSLTYSIEKNGGLIFPLPIAIRRLDAFSTWADVDSDRPIIAITSGMPGDRMRFSIAHELGHLVMHQAIRGRLASVEREADAFAADFLLPETAMRREIIPPVTLTSVARLKPRWGVSIQALVRRSYGLGIITERQYRYLFEQISARGWRTREPSNLDIPMEQPRAFKKMLRQLYHGSNAIEIYAKDMHLTLTRAIELSGEDATRSDLPLEVYDVSATQPQPYAQN